MRPEPSAWATPRKAGPESEAWGLDLKQWVMGQHLWFKRPL